MMKSKYSYGKIDDDANVLTEKILIAEKHPKREDSKIVLCFPPPGNVSFVTTTYTVISSFSPVVER